MPEPCLGPPTNSASSRTSFTACLGCLIAQSRNCSSTSFQNISSLCGCLRACLPTCRVNVTLGPKEERILITGLHTVADIHCTCCDTVLGWKYVSGDQEDQVVNDSDSMNDSDSTWMHGSAASAV